MPKPSPRARRGHRRIEPHQTAPSRDENGARRARGRPGAVTARGEAGHGDDGGGGERGLRDRVEIDGGDGVAAGGGEARGERRREVQPERQEQDRRAELETTRGPRAEDYIVMRSARNAKLSWKWKKRSRSGSPPRSTPPATRRPRPPARTRRARRRDSDRRTAPPAPDRRRAPAPPAPPSARRESAARRQRSADRPNAA